MILALFASLLLSGCSPVVDAEFHNATGQSIIVTNLAQSEFQAFIPAGGSAPVNVLLSRSGHPVGFSVASGALVWIYRHHTRCLGSVSPEYWQHGPLESKRLHVSVDSRGRIYLLSPSGSSV
ncbi:MAG TPA: hypothetical protein VH164_02635, partial [Ktedonobacteraceae bacterium]|nr:hypothetical protein [Ktedonobacteraceae bacterium]